MTYTIDADGTFSVDEPDAAAGARRAPRGDAGTDVGGGSAEGTHGGGTRGDGTRPRGVPGRRRPARGDVRAPRPCRRRVWIRPRMPPRGGGSDPLASVPTPSTAAPSTEEATAAVRAHADTVEADVDASRPPRSSAAGASTVACVSTRGQSRTRRADDGSRAASGHLREGDGRDVGGSPRGLTAGSGGAADDVNDARATAPSPRRGRGRTGRSPDAPRNPRSASVFVRSQRRADGRADLGGGLVARGEGATRGR